MLPFCVYTVYLVLPEHIMCTAEQLPFVCQPPCEKKRKRSQSMLWFPRDVVAYRHESH